VGSFGVICVEAGGPTPGLGCAGRGIITALDKLKELGAYEKFQPDVVLYDVLGDVVCGGFSMPMHRGYAQKVFIVTSGEKMSCYAAGNIAMAIENFKGRGYAQLGGFILNRRNVENELENVQSLAKDFDTVIVGELERSGLVQECDRLGTTVINKYPESSMARQYEKLAEEIMKGFE
jgi:nitrogenase iron protein NifH